MNEEKVEPRSVICFGCDIFTPNIEGKFSCAQLIENYLECPCNICFLKGICNKTCENFKLVTRP